MPCLASASAIWPRLLADFDGVGVQKLVQVFQRFGVFGFGERNLALPARDFGGVGVQKLVQVFQRLGEAFARGVELAAQQHIFGVAAFQAL